MNVVSLSLVLWTVFGLFAFAVLLLTFRYIPNDRVGIVEKLWSSVRVGQGRADRAARRGRLPAAAAARRLARALMPFQYRIHKMPLVTIPQGKIGYVFARDGQPLPPTQTLAGNVAASDFQDVASVPARRRPARAAAQDPARGHLRDQPGAVRRDHRASAIYYLPLDAVGSRYLQPHGRRHRPSATASSRS